MEHFDVIVVGLGAIGSAATYQFARRGMRVLGIDRFDPPHAQGSSHGDTRITRFGNLEGLHYTPLVIRSHEIWREIEQETDAGLLTITGGLIIGNPPASPSDPGLVASFVEAASAHGVDHEVLDAAEIRRRFPRFDVRGDEAGYYEPGAGFVRPEACIRAQLGLAEGSGARVRRDERVLSIVPASSRVIVTTPVARFEARTVIVSVGPWIRDWIPAELNSQFSVFRQVLYWFDLDAEPWQFTAPEFPVFVWQVGNEPHQMFYGVPAIDGPSGGVKIATEQYATGTAPDQIDRTVSPSEVSEMYERHGSRLRGVSPRLIRAETCAYTVVHDWEYVIGASPESERVIVASACMGRGFKHSAAIGEALAQLVTTGASDIDIAGFSPRRFGPA